MTEIHLQNHTKPAAYPSYTMSLCLNPCAHLHDSHGLNKWGEKKEKPREKEEKYQHLLKKFLQPPAVEPRIHAPSKTLISHLCFTEPVMSSSSRESGFKLVISSIVKLARKSWKEGSYVFVYNF